MVLKNWLNLLINPRFGRTHRRSTTRFRRGPAEAVQTLEPKALLAATTPLTLGSLNGTTGFQINGIDAQDTAGRSVSGAGDVNGDGFEDIVIGAPPAGSGEAYVVFGKSGGFSSSLALSSLNGTTGFRIDGLATGDQLGSSVSHADVNGDGFSDVILGARFADAGGDANSGQAFVVFGKSTAFTSSLALSSLNGANGFRLDGVDLNDYAGTSVSGAGDVNGDGFEDVIVGAYGAQGDAVTANGGEAYVVFGKSGGFAATLSLGALTGTNGFRIDGAADYDTAGISVAAAGDFNGDGFDDVIVGAQTANSYAGAAYVVLGKSTSFGAAVNLSGISGATGFRISGAAAYSYFGSTVSSAGDVNGDGFDDVIIGAPQTAGPTATDSYFGAAYVVFGKSATADISLGSLNGTTGFRFNGSARFDYAGISVSGAGDVNGDGFDDVMIGATQDSPYGAGAGQTYVLFGKSSAFTATLSRSALNGNNGFQANGESVYDKAGQALGHADVNGDGFEDVIIGAYGVSVGNVSDAGRTYVVFGGNFTGGAETKVGTSASNTLTADRGAAAIDRLIGQQADDTLRADGGADVLIGGQGGDTLEITGSNLTTARARFDGGTGTDTLKLASTVSGVTFNLLSIRSNRIVDIEQIDINGGGANTLVVNPNSVLNISDTSNTLTVLKGSDDTVTVNGFGSPTTQTIGGVSFNVYTAGAATLLVQGQPPAPVDPTPIIAESGTVVVNQAGSAAFTTVTLARNYINPVVIADMHTFNGAGPSTVRIRNVTSNSFQIQVDEWDYLDGAHTAETIGYIVIEAGLHVLPDGTVLQAGTANANQNFTTVNLTGFSQTPVVLTQVQTVNGASAVATRQTAVTSGSFRVRVQEEENADGSHATESIGFLAISQGTGTSGVAFEAGTAGSVTHNFTPVSFTQSFTAPPVFLSSAQTFNGADPIAMRAQSLTTSGVQIKVEEEQSKDQEITHGNEVVGYLVLGSGFLRANPAQIVAETGTVSITQTNKDAFTQVNFSRTYTNPVVIATPPSFAQQVPATVRLRNVTSTGFQIQIDEWDYQDGIHGAETIGYIVVEAGTTVLGDGTVIEAGTVNATDQFASVSLSGFDQVPVILTQSQTRNGGSAIVTRQQNASATGFQVRVQEEQAADGAHSAERIGYIAISAGTGTSGVAYEAALSQNVSHNFKSLTFTQSFTAPPVFLGSFQTFAGADPIAMRYSTLSKNGVLIKAEEEQSGDSEISHGGEVAGYLAFARGPVIGRAPLPFGEVGSVTFAQATAADVQTINLARTYVNPVVIAQPPTANGVDPVTVRVDSVTSNSFTIRMQEWDYLDSIHGQETVGYVVVEAGTYQLADGTLLHAGTTTTDTNFQTVSLAAAGFTGSPVVLSQAQTVNGSSAITTRQRNVSATSFQVALQEEQAGDNAHSIETIGYIAISAGGTALQAGTIGAVNQNFASRNFNQAFSSAPVVLASMQTFAGSDPASLRVRNVTASGFQVKVEEEQSADAEVSHGNEVVGFLSAVAGLLSGTQL